METIRVGFVGLGGICRQRHVPGLQKIPGVELVAVANRSRKSSEQAAREYGIPNVCDEWHDLIGRDDIDAVVIGTWPYMHREISVAALKAGKHVFCQARMAMDYPEARAMYDAARRGHRVAMLCPVPIGLAVDATVGRFLRDERLGPVRLVRVQSFSDAYADPETPMNWRKDHRLSGLNMHTLGMYIEVIHRWLGWTESVCASMQTFTPERVDEAGERIPVQIPDQVLMTANMEGDFPVQYAVSTAVRHGHDSITLYGQNGTLHYDVATDELSYGAARSQTMEPVGIAPEDAYDVANWDVEQTFIDAIRSGTEYHPDFYDGLRYMQVIQAAYDSARENRVVHLHAPEGH